MLGSDWLIHCKQTIEAEEAWFTLRGLDCVLGARCSGVGALCRRRDKQCQFVTPRGDKHQFACINPVQALIDGITHCQNY